MGKVYYIVFYIDSYSVYWFFMYNELLVCKLLWFYDVIKVFFVLLWKINCLNIMKFYKFYDIMKVWFWIYIESK